jgi:hypothetical protein
LRAARLSLSEAAHEYSHTIAAGLRRIEAGAHADEVLAVARRAP